MVREPNAGGQQRFLDTSGAVAPHGRKVGPDKPMSGPGNSESAKPSMYHGQPKIRPLRITSCVVRRRTTKFAAISIPSRPAENRACILPNVAMRRESFTMVFASDVQYTLFGRNSSVTVLAMTWRSNRSDQFCIYSRSRSTRLSMAVRSRVSPLHPFT
jgi:hypothetical protein